MEKKQQSSKENDFLSAGSKVVPESQRPKRRPIPTWRPATTIGMKLKKKY